MHEDFEEAKFQYWSDSSLGMWDYCIGAIAESNRFPRQVLEEAIDPATSETRLIEFAKSPYLYLEREVPEEFRRFARDPGDAFITARWTTTIKYPALSLQEVVLTNPNFPSAKVHLVPDGRSFLKWMNENPNAIMDFSDLDQEWFETMIQFGMNHWTTVELRKIIIHKDLQKIAFQWLDEYLVEYSCDEFRGWIGFYKYEGYFLASEKAMDRLMSMIGAIAINASHKASQQGNPGWAVGYAACLRVLHGIQKAADVPLSTGPLANFF